MKLTILCENHISRAGRMCCVAEHGFSCYIDSLHTQILFDTGNTDVYWKNAEALGIDLQRTETVVLSHHHWDHVGGLRYNRFERKKDIILHPEVLAKMPEDQSKSVEESFAVCKYEGVYEWAPGCFYLGKIPRTNNFEEGAYKGDPMNDDSAVAIATSNGVVVITGCSHAGICNICEYAKEVTGQELYMVMGGFHLFEKDVQAVEGSIEYFKKEKPDFLYPMHCVDFPTLAKYYEVFNITKLSTGDSIVIDD